MFDHKVEVQPVDELRSVYSSFFACNDETGHDYDTEYIPAGDYTQFAFSKQLEVMDEVDKKRVKETRTFNIKPIIKRQKYSDLSRTIDTKSRRFVRRELEGEV